MKIKPDLEAEYTSYVEKNSDPYSRGVVTFTKRWADLMESRVESGEAIEAIADETSREADTESITGFMYGCAVRALAHFWIHGESLRRWHNKETQIGTEGDEANEKGGVLNPAVLVVR